MVHVTLIRVTLRDASHLRDFLKFIAPLANRSIDRELHTLSYDVQVQKDDPSTILLLERCRDRVLREAEHTQSTEWNEVSQRLLHPTADDPVIAHTEEMAFEVTPLLDDETRCRLLSSNGILVFCGSRVGAKERYCVDAVELGKIIAARGRTLVYGGGSIGVMGALANSVHDNGGKVQGVIPHALAPKELSGPCIGNVIFTETMGARKSTMFALSSTVIALPGGIGTFDELLEVLTLFQLNHYRPKIGLLNSCNFFGPFLSLLNYLIKQGFLNADALGYLVIAPTASELMDKLDNFTPPISAASLVWGSRP